MGGAICAALVGILCFAGFGLPGIFLLGAFFVLGNLATAWKINTKQALGSAETAGGKRNAMQVFANGGVAAITGAMVFFYTPYYATGFLMMAAGLSSATADTLSSELGTLYGKRFYNITSFRKDIRGENGVVSLEGTLFGLLGSLLIAGIYSMADGWTIDFIIIVIAGTAGNILDSILGATLERKGLVKNDLVNFSNTVFAALVAWWLSIIF